LALRVLPGPSSRWFKSARSRWSRPTNRWERFSQPPWPDSSQRFFGSRFPMGSLSEPVSLSFRHRPRRPTGRHP